MEANCSNSFAILFLAPVTVVVISAFALPSAMIPFQAHHKEKAGKAFFS
jgi:hypothetical protein